MLCVDLFPSLKRGDFQCLMWRSHRGVCWSGCTCVTSLYVELGLECQIGIKSLFNDSGSLTEKNNIHVVHFLRCVHTDFHIPFRGRIKY